MKKCLIYAHSNKQLSRLIPHLPGVKKATINVGGHVHCVLWDTIEKLPHSRLARIRNVKTAADLYALCDDFDPLSGELFFDKHPLVFVSILNFYRISKLHMPEDICPIGFQDEINFWGIGECNCKYFDK